MSPEPKFITQPNLHAAPLHKIYEHRLTWDHAGFDAGLYGTHSYYIVKHAASGKYYIIDRRRDLERGLKPPYDAIADIIAGPINKLSEAKVEFLKLRRQA